MLKILGYSMVGLCLLPLTVSAQVVQVGVDGPDRLAALSARGELLRSYNAGDLDVALPRALDVGHGALPVVRPAAVVGSTACGRRVGGTLEADDFELADGTLFDVYEFLGFAAGTVTLELHSSQLDAALVLLDAEGQVLATDDDGGPGTDSRIEFDLPADGVYQVAATSAVPGQKGGYELTVRCAGSVPPGPCVEGPGVACLAGRFAVTTAWATGLDSGIADVEKLTEDTLYFWFFEPTNVEMVTKVLDACLPPFDRFWVFSAGLTNVGTFTEVIDTEKGEFVDYVNDHNTPFQPIQDTDAFATCP